MKQFYIYQIINLLNGKMYIGKSNSSRRWKTHLNIAKGGKNIYHHSYSAIHAAINKYGSENFEFRIIQYVNESQVSDAEIYWIDFYQTNVRKYRTKFGYNLTLGGEGWLGQRHSAKTKEKLRRIRSGTKHSTETIIQMKKDRQGINKGSKNQNAKLDEEKVVSIKRMIFSGMNNREIAKIYNLHHATISAIRVGKLWSQIVIE